MDLKKIPKDLATFLGAMGEIPGGSARHYRRPLKYRHNAQSGDWFLQVGSRHRIRMLRREIVEGTGHLLQRLQVE